MKKSAYLILSIVVGSALAGSSALADDKKADKAEAKASSAAQGEMTKQQAEHRVRTKYPAAKVSSSEQKTVNGKSVWIVRFTETGGNISQQMMVDENGKLTRL